jgi:hypothetical protein
MRSWVDAYKLNVYDRKTKENLYMSPESIFPSKDEIRECYTGFVPPEPCPKDCQGLIASKQVTEGSYTYRILVCPNPAWIGSPNSETDYCDPLSEDTIVMHCDTVPSDEEYQDAAKHFGQ